MYSLYTWCGFVFAILQEGLLSGAIHHCVAITAVTLPCASGAVYTEHRCVLTWAVNRQQLLGCVERLGYIVCFLSHEEPNAQSLQQQRFLNSPEKLLVGGWLCSLRFDQKSLRHVATGQMVVSTLSKRLFVDLFRCFEGIFPFANMFF